MTRAARIATTPRERIFSEKELVTEGASLPAAVIAGIEGDWGVRFTDLAAKYLREAFREQIIATRVLNAEKPRRPPLEYRQQVKRHRKIASLCDQLGQLLRHDIRDGPTHTSIFQKMAALGSLHTFGECEIGLATLTAAARHPALPYRSTPRKAGRRSYEHWREFIQCMALLYDRASGKEPPRAWDPYSSCPEPAFWTAVFRSIGVMPADARPRSATGLAQHAAKSKWLSDYPGKNLPPTPLILG